MGAAALHIPQRGDYRTPPEPPQDHPVWVVLLALSLIVFLYL